MARRSSGTRRGFPTRAVVVLVISATLAAGCRDAGPDLPTPTTPSDSSASRDAVAPVPVPTAAPGDGPTTTAGDGELTATAALTLLDAPASLRPSAAPVQAGPELAGRPLPTNRWWTSALTGPWTQVLWARPVVAQVGPDGLAVAGTPRVAASPDSVVQPFEPLVRIGGGLEGVEVARYDDLSVTLRLARRGAASPVVVTLAHGAPGAELDGVDLAVDLLAGAEVATLDGVPLPAGGRATGAGLTVRSGTRELQLVTGTDTTWTRQGTVVTALGRVHLLVAPRPEGADRRWVDLLRVTARHPLTSTATTLSVDLDAGVVRQELLWNRTGGQAAPIAVLPHHRLAGAGGTSGAGGTVEGRYPAPSGPLSLVLADRVELTYELPGLLPGVPALDLTAADRAAVLADLERDLVDPAAEEARARGGSYSGAKALGRLALLAQIAAEVGRTDVATELADDIARTLRDWARDSGAADDQLLAYDRTWGGVVARPSEFGNLDYNDHHFQFAYLITAAATLATIDPAAARAVAPIIDALVADVIGGAITGDERFPSRRGFDPYLGHSAASGFVPFGDGNNQESSSEAVQAWEAILRWALVTDRPALADAALAHYGIEAFTARTYWLGELGGSRPAGYAHRTVGIVWDGKIDFATFFDPRPAAIIGIQLLPFTPGSLYRRDPTTAAQRVVAAGAGAADAPLWPDLFLMELAISDPALARSRLRVELPIEAGNSAAWTRMWITMLATLGRPATGIRADSTLGLAFAGPAGRRYVAVNPTATARTVTFRDPAGQVVHTMTLAPGERRTD